MTDAVPKQPAVRMRTLISWGLIGQIAYVFSQLFVLLSLAQLTNVETVGAFGLASAISLPISFFFNLGLRVNWATDIAGEFAFSDFLWLRIISCLLSYALIVLVGVLFLSDLTLWILIVFGLAKTVEMYSEFFYGVFQRADSMHFVARSQIIRGVLSSLGFGLVLYQGGSVTIAFIAQLLIWSMVAFLIDLPKARSLVDKVDLSLEPKWEKVFALARVSLPLGINGGLAAIQGSIPRYAIGFWLGLAAVGQFTVVSYAMQAMNMIVQSVSSSVQSRMGVYIANGDKVAFYKSLVKLVVLATFFGIVAALVGFLYGDEILSLLFGAEYDGLGTVLGYVLIASIIHSVLLFLQVGILANRKFYSVVIVRAVFLLVMGLTCAGAAAFGNLTSVTLAIIATFVLQALVLFVLVKQISFPGGHVAADKSDV